MNNFHQRKSKVITFEADEDLFAEFIAWKSTNKDHLSIGYISQDSHFAFYKPLKETEVTKILNDHIETLKKQNERLVSDCNRYYVELKTFLDKPDNNKEIKKKRWY